MKKITLALCLLIVGCGYPSKYPNNKPSQLLTSSEPVKEYSDYCNVKIPSPYIIVQDSETKIYYISNGGEYFCDRGSFGYEFTQFTGGELMLDPTPYTDTCRAKAALMYRIGKRRIPTKLVVVK